MISRFRQSASYAVMPTITQRFADFCPAETFLRRTRCVDFSIHSPSVQSFVRGFAEKSAPSCVINGLGKHPARQSFDIQVFNKNATVVVHDESADLMMKVVALILDLCVNLLDGLLCFLARITTALLSRQHLLSVGKSFFRLPEVARVFNLSAIGQDGERGQANINAHGISQNGKRLGLDFAGKANVILSGFAQNGNSLDRAFNGTMKFDLDLTSALNAKLAVVQQSASVAIARKGDAVVSIARFEARESGFAFAFLASAKERLERFINSFEHILTAREILKRTITIGTNLFQLVRLTVVVDRNVTNAVSVPAFLKGRVIKPLRFGKLSVQKLSLLFRREQSVFESLAHLLRLLIGDVLFDRCFGNVTYAPDVITSAPQRGQTRFEPRKFITQHFRCESFELRGDLCRRKRWVCLKEHVNVVRHYLKCLNLAAKLSGFLVKKLFESLCKITTENAFAVLWTPHQVILEREDSPGVSSVAFGWHLGQ